MKFGKQVQITGLLKRKVTTETTYKNGRIVREEGYLSGLGVNHKCSCRDVLSLGEVFEREWIKTTSAVNDEMQFLEGLGTYDNFCYNTVIITSQKVKNRLGAYKRVHELDISAGPHGEHGKLIRFDDGITTIREVKQKCAEMIVSAYKRGDWYFYLRDASDGEGCSKCAVTEKILEQSQ